MVKSLEKLSILEDSRQTAALLDVFRSLDVEVLADRMVRPIADWLGADFGICLGSVPGRRKLLPIAGTTDKDDPRRVGFSNLEPKIVRGIGERPVLRDGWGELADAVHEWPGSDPDRVVLVPVHDGEMRLTAVMAFVVEKPVPSSRLEQVAQFVELCRDAVGNALQVLALRELIIKDDTANCFNRRHFEDFLPEELARASRFRSPVSLIFLDMDNLKEVNNRHGHSMGSRTLFEVSVRVRGKIRKFDKLFRFGGDEFCIVLPETEWHGAVEVAERVRQVISGKNLLMRELGDGEGVSMTASLGVASFPLHAGDRRELVQRADRAMQKIKASGKDGIGVADVNEKEDPPAGESDG